MRSLIFVLFKGKFIDFLFFKIFVATKVLHFKVRLNVLLLPCVELNKINVQEKFVKRSTVD